MACQAVKTCSGIRTAGCATSLFEEAARLQAFPDDYRFSGAWSECLRQLWECCTGGLGACCRCRYCQVDSREFSLATHTRRCMERSLILEGTDDVAGSTDEEDLDAASETTRRGDSSKGAVSSLFHTR